MRRAHRRLDERDQMMTMQLLGWLGERRREVLHQRLCKVALSEQQELLQIGHVGTELIPAP